MIAMINTPQMIPIIIATGGLACDVDTVPVVFLENVTIHSSVVSLKNRLFPTLACINQKFFFTMGMRNQTIRT